MTSSLFRVLFLAAACLLVLGACTPADDEDQPTTTLESAGSVPDATTTTMTTTAVPQRGGAAVVGETDEPMTLNSFLPGGSSLIVNVLGQAYSAGAQEISGYTLELEPELLVELPTTENGGVALNDDGSMTVSYQIRDDAVWEDMTPVSGADFQFTYETIVDESLPIARTNYEDIVSTEVGEKSFSFTMELPTVRYELMFGEIIPEHAVAGTDFEADWNDTRWPSSGPFVFENWVAGESLTVVRNDNYWKKDSDTGSALPHLDSVTFRFLADSEEAIDAFVARDVDIINPDPTSNAIDALRSLEPEGAHVEVLSGPFWEHLNFQFGPGRFTQNPASCNEFLEMRLAVVQSIDRGALTEALFGGQVMPLPSYVDAFLPELSHGAWDRYELDAVAASEHYASAVELAGVDCTVVFSTTADNDARVAMAAMLTDMFATTGIPFEVHLEDSSLLLGTTMESGRWDVGEWAWTGSPGLSGLVAIHDLFDPKSPPPEGANFYRWGTPDSSVVDAATERFGEVHTQMNSTIDEAELVSLIADAEQILAENIVFLPLYSRPVTGAVWADEIGGYKLNPTLAGHTWNIENWYRTDR
ncbi:MAG: ABC transporter substrate-binding protein [Acidimicrobiia bacterium]